MGSQRWLFSPRVDVAMFAGSALASALVVAIGRAFGVVGDAPLWSWLCFVLAIDVAHVWATTFRVYFDRDELSRRPVLYASAPLVAFGLSVVAHASSPEFFWRSLAYVAVFHFIRQQVGWMTLYGRRARDSDATLRFDRLALWACTLGPVVWWHANLPRTFAWFKAGDFVPGLPSAVGDVALAVAGVVLVGWLVVHLRGGLHLGKLVLVASTAFVWFGGIVMARDDFTFTVMNVTLHGVPYLVLLWHYARGRQKDAVGYGSLAALVMRLGLGAFLVVLITFAFVEELLWDHLVWHERPQVFGDLGLDLPPVLLTLLVPLLSLPQTTHYLLDGFVWRTRDDPALASRLGWQARSAQAEND